MENGTRGKFFYISFLLFFGGRGRREGGREGNLTRTLLEEKYSVDTYDSSPRWIRGNNEYRPSRKFAQTRSRRPSVKNTTYYNKPFRWLQVVGSKTTFSPFQPLSQCSTFLSFPLCMWGTATCVSYFRIAFHGSWNTQPREFQTIRVPVFSFFFFPREY